MSNLSTLEFSGKRVEPRSLIVTTAKLQILDSGPGEPFELHERAAQAITVPTGGGTLTAEQCRHRILTLGGSPAGATNLVLTADDDGFYIIKNACGQTITIKGASGDTGIAVATAKVAVLAVVSNVVFRVTADTTP